MVGLTSVLQDTYKKADSDLEEYSCQYVGSSVPSSEATIQGCGNGSSGRIRGLLLL